MKSSQIRKRFIDYFVKILVNKKRGHIEVSSSALVPEHHPTLLFTNSGMVQFTPYFLGEKDPVKDFGSSRLCSTQKCIRTVDLDKVGKSKYHLTFFEMLGSWSIGDYGKKEAVEFAFDLLTNKNYGFGLDVNKLLPTVFCGNKEVPCDQETINAWKSVGIPDDKISRLPASENWWAPAGFNDPGPCGPCTEVLYDRGEKYDDGQKGVPGSNDNPRYLEIWNAGVFMQFNRDESGKLHRLDKMSVDTGAGLERIALLLQGKDSVYETDLFEPIVSEIKTITSVKNFQSPRVKSAIQRSADHIKAAAFIISENVFPSNKDQGYVLRRLLRTAFNDFQFTLKTDLSNITKLIPVVVDLYKDTYPEVDRGKHIEDVIEEELKRYEKVARQTRHIIKRNYVYKKKDIVDAFDIYQSTGASVDLTSEIARKLGLKTNNANFDDKVQKHRKKSREGAGKRFKGGLSGDDPKQRRLHTATHLLHRALIEILGSHVKQMGSNITPDRLRFDFSHPQKLTREQVEEVERLVNKKIAEAHPVKCVTLPKEKAEKAGAFHFFGEKYGDNVCIYYIGDNLKNAWSKEFCGGPHVVNTKEIGKFKIIKEEGIGKGVRRIKGVVGT